MLLKRTSTEKITYTWLCITEGQRATLLPHGDELVGEVVLGVCIRACWVIYIIECSTVGHRTCDTAIYHSPMEHWRSAIVSSSGPLRETVASGGSVVPSSKEYGNAASTYMYIALLI